jgi:hypothetical protein
VLFVNFLGGIGEGRDLPFLAPAKRDRITASSRMLPVGNGVIPCLSQRHQQRTTQSHIPALALHHRSQHPALGPVLVNDEVKTIPVSVSAGFLQVANLDSGKRPVRVAPSPLPAPLFFMFHGRLHPPLHPTK